jgi:hypothetical protein
MKQDEHNRSLLRKEEPVFTFRAGFFEYLLVGIFASIFFLTLLQHPEPAGFVLLAAGTGLILYWRSDFLFQITPKAVSYRHNFKLQTIPFAALSQVVIATGGRPPIAMIFVPSVDSKLKPIVINIKPLRRKDLKKLAIFLPKIAPQVVYDSRFLLMAEGKMPSLLFSHQ